MSKKRGNWRIGLPLAAALERCHAAAVRYWQFATGIVCKTAARRSRRPGQLEVSRPMEISHLLQTSSSHQSMELVDLIDVLSVGDRIRILCDDGVVVAEKTSQTQFELIYCQTMSELIH